MAWPVKLTSCLLEAELFARGDADLLVDDIDAGDALGDRVLDLEAGVHLDEVELAVLVEELDRAGARVFELAHGGGADLADLVALFGGDGRGGGLFPDLLVAALQRAVAGAEMDGVALAVAHHLDFDVARLVEILLDVDAVVAEGGLGLGAGGRPGDRAVSSLLRDLHAAPAAAGRRLDDDRVADLRGGRHGFVLGRRLALGAGDHRECPAPPPSAWR